MDALDAFKIYMLEVFEEEYDDENFGHRLKLSLFEAGWDALYNHLKLGKR